MAPPATVLGHRRKVQMKPPLQWTLKTDRERAIFKAGYNCGDVDRQMAQERGVPDPTLLRRLLQLAKEATNGWACYAKLPAEHDNIASLHREIAAFERAIR